MAASGRGGWRSIAIGATGVAAAMTFAFFWSVLRPPPPGPVERFTVGEYDPTAWGIPTLLPDGSGIVYGFDQLMLRRWSSLDPVPLTTEGSFPVVSPSGDELAFITEAGELRVMPIAGGIARTLAEGAACCMSWGPDGFLYFSPSVDRAIQRVRETGGVVERVTTRLVGDATQGDFQILDDGDVGVFTGSWAAEGPRIDAIRLSTGERKAVTSGLRPFVTPTGHLVFATLEGEILAAPFDAGAMELNGPAVPVVEDVLLGVGDYPMFSLSSDGTLLYVEAAGAPSGQALAVMDLAGNQQVLPIQVTSYGPLGPSWSPDGASIVYESGAQIYTYDVMRNTAPRQITLEGENWSAVYSPDGTRIAFASRRQGTEDLDLFVKDLNDDAPPRLLLRLAGEQLVTGWPADTLLVFESGGGEADDLWMVDPSDSGTPEARPYLTSEASLERLVVSPDGHLAAYRSNETGADEIYVRSFPNPGERMPISRGGGFVPYWSPDGSTLYYLGGLNYGSWVAVRLQREPVPSVLSVDTLFTMQFLPTSPFPGGALHPDGDRIVVGVFQAGARPEGEATAPQRVVLVKNFFEELKRLVPN